MKSLRHILSVALVLLTIAVPGLPLMGACENGCLVYYEYVSCTGTQDGSGTAANTGYTPTTPERTSSGSVIPAVAITANNATTRTGYIFDFEQPITEDDILVIEYNTGQGWMMVSEAPKDGVNNDFQGSVFIGVSYSVVDEDTVEVGFSNAGRIKSGTYGRAAANWQAVTNLGWKWRLKKISTIEYTPAMSGGDVGAYQIPVYVNDWTGEYTTDFETYYNGSQIQLFGEDGPSVFMTKQNFILVSSVFGAFLAAVILFALFKAVL